MMCVLLNSTYQCRNTGPRVLPTSVAIQAPRVQPTSVAIQAPRVLPTSV